MAKKAVKKEAPKKVAPKKVVKAAPKKEAAKKAPTKKVLEQLSAKKVGNNLIIIIDKKKYTKKVDAESVKRISNKILLYNKNNNQTIKNELLDIFEPSRLVQEVQKSKEKGLKKSLKKAEREEEIGSKVAVNTKKAATKKVLEKVKKATSKKDSKIKNEDADLLIVGKNGGMVMKGFETVEMPPLLVQRIEEFLNAEQSIKALLNFWMLCLLNPNEVARTKLFDYLSHHNLTITPSGYIVTFRMVKTTSEKDVYTDNHTKTCKYKIGEVFAIPREQCDEDGSRDCSRGLHTGSPKFIGIVSDKKVEYKEGESVGYGYGVKYVTTKAQNSGSYGTGYDRPKDKEEKFDNSFGNQAVMCYVNPAHVVSVPDSDTRKMRSCELYFAKLVTPEEVIDMVEKDYLLYDDNYNKIEFEQLKELLKDKDLKEYVSSKTDYGKRVNVLREKLEAHKSSIKLSTDNINPKLSIEELKEIVKRRNIYLK